MNHCWICHKLTTSCCDLCKSFACNNHLEDFSNKKFSLTLLACTECIKNAYESVGITLKGA